MLKKSVLKDIYRYRVLYLFLLPAIITVAVFSYRPMVGIIMAFENYDVTKGILGSVFVGFEHFRKFLGEPDFYRALKNSLGINILLIVLGFPLPIIFALMINELSNKIFKRVTQTITYLPHFISWVVIGGLVYRLLDYDSGSMNALINLLGGEKIAFMRESDYFWPVLITVSIWKELGWNSIIYLAAIQSIDTQLYEASIVDGAGRFKNLIHITIPGIAPTIGLLFIFSVGTLVGGASLDAIFNLKNPLVMNVANTLDLYTYTEGVQWGHISYATAIGLTQSVISFGLVLFANSMSRKINGYVAF